MTLHVKVNIVKESVTLTLQSKCPSIYSNVYMKP